ncbi:MAG TPA: hydroxymethylbilane synthase [Candidatus Saccharimonadales bacterium]|nr:hydroxymethylbilane synthase [Candidatus Saccharimonadales bacterium]
MNNKIVLGTRGSKLALIQTEIVKKQINTLFPSIQVLIKIITTTGDKNMNPVPLDTVGKDWFTKQIDKALLDGRIDAAVHSLKDLSETLPKGLTIAAIPKREDAKEALVSDNNVLFKKLKKGAIIGTDSTRRKSQLLHKRPDLLVKSVRGNVLTRLEKLKDHHYDGLFLAVAGLKRLDLEHVITEYFSEKNIVPAPGQGALAVVVRKDRKDLLTSLKKLNHLETLRAVKAERAFSKVFGGGCSMPIGAYATCKKETIQLTGMVGSLDGKYVIKETIEGKSNKPITLGKELGIRMIKKSSPWYTLYERPYVVITRPEKEGSYLMKNIPQFGLQPLFYPTISIKKVRLTEQDREFIKNVEQFDWIIFTSKNGVKYFMQTLSDLNISIPNNGKTSIAVVGESTEKLVKEYGFTVSFRPKHFTSANLSQEINNIKGKKVLLVQGNLSNSTTAKELQKKGVEAIRLIIYKTEFPKKKNPQLEDLIKQQKIKYLTFSSPSTVKGFLKTVKNDMVFSLPVISIGPTTTKELEKCGFNHIYTADTYTEKGMYVKMREILV